MVCDLEPTPFEDQAVWRIGHAPIPWGFADWAYADQHGRFRFDGRWDDPEGSYRVLYTSTSRFGAFVEALGDFRPDPELAAGLKGIASDDEEPAVPPGHLPVSWLRGRVVGEATVTARCAQVGHSRSLACL